MNFRRNHAQMRRFYDWFSRFYGLVEGNLGPSLKEVVQLLDPNRDRFREDYLLELACGSANFGLLMAPRLARYEGHDQSENMLVRARHHWMAELEPSLAGTYPAPPFKRTNLLEFNPDQSGRPDWIALSFALHLFPPEEESRLLEQLFKASAKGVIVVDHIQQWSFGLGLVEWLEGSWFDKYIKMDFAGQARRLGAQNRCQTVAGCRSWNSSRPDHFRVIQKSGKYPSSGTCA